MNGIIHGNTDGNGCDQSCGRVQRNFKQPHDAEIKQNWKKIGDDADCSHWKGSQNKKHDDHNNSGGSGKAVDLAFYKCINGVYVLKCPSCDSNFHIISFEGIDKFINFLNDHLLGSG